MRKKKTLQAMSGVVLGALALSITCFAAPVFAETSNTSDLHFITGTMSYSDISCDPIDVYFSTDLDELLSGDNTKYCKDIAMTAEILATDIYGGVQVTADSDSEGSSSDTNIYYKYLGMDDAQVIDLSQNEYTEDPNDVSRFIVSHKKIISDGAEKEIIVVSVEGTNGSYEQWNSNYDTGADSDVYPGTHSEWVDKDNHKGFDVTYRRVLAGVQDYINKNVSSTAAKTILITGHSRGGAVANLLGKYFENDTQYKSFTYTFAAPAVTIKSDVSAPTIFNVINEDDAIPYFPASSWGFHRYGTDVAYDLTDLTEQWKSLTGVVYKSAQGDSVTELESDLASIRSDLYTFNEKVVYSKDFDTMQEAQAQVNENVAQLTEEGFTKDYYRYDISKVMSETETYYTVSGYISPAWLMEFLAGLASTPSSDQMSYMGSMTSLLKYTKISEYNSIATFMVTKFLNQGIIYAHSSYAYYLAASGGEEAGSTEITGTASVSGVPMIGQTLVAVYENGNAGSYLTYQWIRIDSSGTQTVIPNATSKEYVVTTSDLNCQLQVVISGVGAFSGTLTSALTATAYQGLIGDVNMSGHINIVDAQAAYDLAKGKYDHNENYSAMKALANVNGDDTVDAADAFAIQVYLHTGEFSFES